MQNYKLFLKLPKLLIFHVLYKLYKLYKFYKLYNFINCFIFSIKKKLLFLRPENVKKNI